MKVRLALCALFATLVVTGCGEGRSFGAAAEEWCERRWPEAKQERCLEVIVHRGPEFLQAIEFRESLAAELAGLESFHP